MHQTRRFWTLLLPLTLMTMVLVAAVPLSSVPPLTGDDEVEGFRDVMYPRLLSLVESVNKVESMVAERSRNVVALQAHANKIETLVKQIDDYLASSAYHHDFPSVVNRYRTGRESILAAISGAREALRTFDFSTLPQLIALFDAGSDRLDQAVSLLQET